MKIVFDVLGGIKLSQPLLKLVRYNTCRRSRSCLWVSNRNVPLRIGSEDALGRCGVVGSTLAFGSIGHGFESGYGLFSHHGKSAFSKLRSLAKCSLDDSVRRLL